MKHINKKIFLLLIILIQVVYLTVSFGINKQGYHSDEMWNYGFANSTDLKNIYYYNRENGEHKYIYEWTDSKVLFDYITVDKSEIFAYDKVYENLEKDLNPPFQFMILHFICSLFPGKWSRWFGFSINIISFILMQIFLYKFIKRVTKSQTAAYIGLLSFGFSVGATSITTFLRMYALGVALSMMFVFYVNEVYLYKDEWKECKKNIIKAAIVLLLGALTIHQFLILAFFVVLLYCIYFFFKKYFKVLLSFGVAMLAAVGLSMVIFPSTLSHLFGYTENSIVVKYPTAWQFRIYLSFLTKDLSGIHISAVRTMAFSYFVVGCIVAFLILIPICFLLRNESGFKNFTVKVKDRIIYGFKNIRKVPYTVVALFGAIILFVFIDAFNSSVFRMGMYARRYIFLVYPLYSAGIIIIIYYILKFLINDKIINGVVFTLLGLLMVVLTYVYSSNPFYLKHYEEGITLDDLGPDANFIAVMSEDWVLVSAANELCYTNSYFLTDYSNYDKMNYDGVDSKRPLYLILDVSGLNENDYLSSGANDGIFVVNEYSGDNSDDLGFNKTNIVNYYENLDFVKKMEYVGYDDMFGRNVEIYRLN